MLSQIVAPLVDTQIRRLANSQATYSTLIETVAKWLSYLGVKAQVTHLTHQSGQIHISLTVNKPHTCSSYHWQQILDNLDRQQVTSCLNCYDQISSGQRSKLQRLFAYLIQNSELINKHNSNALSNFLYELNLDELMILGIRCALKVPQPIERLLRELDPDVVALAIPQAMKIALSDEKLNQEAETTINAMLKIAKSSNNSTFALNKPGNISSHILH
ncbi:MAG: hypothetical protein QNJ60_01230 [Xenococcaceae cyanobacterium MO_188.B19]|nr:hypothetical protein [Xenococcaceae cyanobacterium MO_188.B19]